MVFDTSEDRHRSTHTHSQMVIASQWQMDCPFHFEQHEEWVVHIHSGRLEQNRAAPSQQWCHLQKKSQSRHIWQRRVGRPWWEIYLDRDKWWNIFLQQSRCISNAPWLAYRWLLTWRHPACGGKTLPITIHACGCGKSLMSFFFVTCHLSGRHTARY